MTPSLIAIYILLAALLLVGIWTGVINVGSKSANDEEVLREKWIATIVLGGTVFAVIGEQFYPIVKRNAWHLGYPNTFVTTTLGLSLPLPVTLLWPFSRWTAVSKEMWLYFFASLI